jgi:hypothetical protein
LFAAASLNKLGEPRKVKVEEAAMGVPVAMFAHPKPSDEVA